MRNFNISKQTNEMKLYHATSAKNINKINGVLKANLTEKIGIDPQLNIKCIYGFDNISDAEDFIIYCNNENHYAIYEIDTKENKVVLDTEYNGNAFAVICEEIDAILIKEKNTLDC